MVACTVAVSDTCVVQPETRYAKSGEVSIAYRVFGDGPFDVVYHPGYISHVELMTEMPTYQGRIAEHLSSFSRLIVFDQRGVGMSDRMSGTPGLEMRMDDVRAVMDAAGSSRAAIFSASVGVPTSLLFAATYPERTSALVLVRGFARFLWALDYPWGWTPEKQRSMVDAYQQLYFGSPRDAAEAMRTVTSGLSDDDLSYLRRAAASPGTIETLATIDQEVDARHVLPAVRVATLLVHSVEDPAFPIEGARHMAERIPGARLVEVPGTSPLPTVCSTSQSTSCTVCGKPAAGRSRSLIGCWRRCCLRTSSVRPSGRQRWEIEPGTSSCSVTTSWYGCSSSGSGDVRSTPPATGSLRASTGRRGRSGARRRSPRACTRWGWRCARVCTPASVSCWTAKWRGSLSTPVPGLLPEAAPGEVLVSNTVKDLVAGSALAFQDRGTHELKGVPGEWRLFAVEHA